MVNGLAFSKNVNKMKAPKLSGKSRRSKYYGPKDQRSKSPKMEPAEGKTATKKNPEISIKSGSWKCKRGFLPIGSTLQIDDTKPASSSSSKFQPGILYSDVLFSGEKASTLVKIRCQKSRQVGSQAQSHSKSKKWPKHNDKATEINKETMIDSQANGGSDLSAEESKDTGQNTQIPHDSHPINSTELTATINQLIKHMNIQIPSWNFTDFGTFNDIPRFVCQFDDYNYLACEKVAFVALRLATDGKFKC